MPSLWNESFGLVAAEAMINGIPVLASNRGALPETIGDAGFLFDIPASYTPETREVPTAEEVEPWVETIIRLWDDAAEYERWSRAARERARQWHPDRFGADLPRVLRQHHPSARPAAGAEDDRRAGNRHQPGLFLNRAKARCDVAARPPSWEAKTFRRERAASAAPDSTCNQSTDLLPACPAMASRSVIRAGLPGNSRLFAHPSFRRIHRCPG